MRDLVRGRGARHRRISAPQGREERRDITRGCQEEDHKRARNEQRDEGKQPSLIPSHSHNAQTQSDDETEKAQRPYKGRNRAASARLQDDQQRQHPAANRKGEHSHDAIAHGQPSVYLSITLIPGLRRIQGNRARQRPVTHKDQKVSAAEIRSMIAA